MDCDVEWLRALVRQVPDFPEPGVRYADITPVLANADALRCAVELLADEFVGREIDLIAGIEARGFILAAPIACRLGCGFVPIRKPGKLPAAVHETSYDLEYGSGVLQMHRDATAPGQRIVIIDDVLATGGTAAAAATLIEETGATVDGLGFLLSIAGLGGADLVADHKTVIALGEI
jgi:adenine phosphoribosyltransferase